MFSMSYLNKEFKSAGKFYGPLHYSRSDHIVQMIMKGRDYGLSDYRTVRRELGLADHSDWHLINPQFAWTSEGAKVGRLSYIVAV